MRPLKLKLQGLRSYREEQEIDFEDVSLVAIVGDSGRLTGVLRSVDGHAPWLDLGVPQTAEQNGVLFGAHPGGQGSIHLSVAADPSNPQLVYVGGDRQPYFGEGVSGSGNYFPNSIGARDYSGRLFRGDASLPVGTGWTPLTHSGTSNNSAPHADSRDMAIDAAGNVIETDDGGIYKRTQPGSATGSWVSLNGNLQTTEYHGIAWDAVSHRVIGGAQDTGHLAVGPLAVGVAHGVVPAHHEILVAGVDFKCLNRPGRGECGGKRRRDASQLDHVLAARHRLTAFALVHKYPHLS